MKLTSKKIAAVLILSGVMLVWFAGAALGGPPWADAPNSWWVSSYDITETQVATVADGYPDGNFHPGVAVTRGQFAKMAVNGLGVATADPATATFKDVIPSHRFYVYIEGAYAKELIGGYPTGGLLYFRPDSNITRQQANSILGRYLSQLEIDITGSIHGEVNTYGTLDLWYKAEGSFHLNAFDDAGKVATSHKATTAYLIYRDIVEGSNSKLSPGSTLLRSQAVALILRVKAEAQAIMTPPAAPTNLAVVATDGGTTVTYDSVAQRYVGNDPTPRVTGDTLPSSALALYDTVNGVTSKALFQDTSNSAGKFYSDLDPALHSDWLKETSGAAYVIADGLHVFTAKVKNDNGLVSAASAGVTYLLDTVLPAGSIIKPVVPTGRTSAILTSTKPEFTATATDTATTGGTPSGVKQVEFQYSVKQTTPSWQTISADTTPDTGTTTYTAAWPSTGSLSNGLSEGVYLLRVVITDNAGNQRTSTTVEVMLDTVRPTVTITSPLGISGKPAYTESTAPVFTATASDPAGTGVAASGIEKVQFYYAAWTATGQPMSWSGFTLLATDTAPDTGTSTYAASYSGLAEGRYIFAARALDLAGNESVLSSGSTYVTGATQEVVIDGTAPVVTISATGANQSLVVEENKANSVAITWALVDVTPPDTVKLEYTLNSSASMPVWATIDAATLNDGSFVWSTPDVDGDKPNVQFRITAVDKAGSEVGDLPGHTTVAYSNKITIFDLPQQVTNLTGDDPDLVETGVDGRDFHASWAVSTSTDITQQKLYILPITVTSLDLSSHAAVATFSDNTTHEWTGTASLVTDSRGVALAAGLYRIWVLVIDVGGRQALSATPSGGFQVTAE